MIDRDDQMKRDARKNEWEDRADIAKDKVKLDGHEAEERAGDLRENTDKDWEHTKNVAGEKATEAKNTIEEDAQKLKHRWEENFGKNK